MTFHVSTGLRNSLLLSASLKTQLDLGFIMIFSGPVPATADAATDPSCVMLSKISNNSTATGIKFDTVVTDGVIAKAPAEIWQGTNAAAGVATFYRHVTTADAGTAASTTLARLQGNVGYFGTELNLTNTTLAAAAPQKIDNYVVALPTL